STSSNLAPDVARRSPESRRRGQRDSGLIIVCAAGRSPASVGGLYSLNSRSTEVRVPLVLPYLVVVLPLGQVTCMLVPSLVRLLKVVCTFTCTGPPVYTPAVTTVSVSTKGDVAGAMTTLLDTPA